MERGALERRLEACGAAQRSGRAQDGLHGLQQAWIEHQVPQCGYCQPGFIMAATALLAQEPKPSDADLEASITNICRCGTYARIKQAIRAAAG